MEKNVGHAIDKAVRIVVGVILLAWPVVGEGESRWFGLFGIVLILTVVIGWCPAWSVLGINTVKKP